MEQLPAQRGHRDRSRRQVGHLQIEHQQGNGDGKDAVAEGFEATGLFFDGPCSLFTAHSLSPCKHCEQKLPVGKSVSTQNGRYKLACSKASVPLLKDISS